MEIWKPIIGYEHKYEISNLGRVRSNRILKGWFALGYYHMQLYNNGKKKTFLLHRLIAINFIPMVEGKNFINHIDGNKTNNSIENLEWCTQSENSLHAHRMGLSISPSLGKFGKEHNRSKGVIQMSLKGEILNFFNSGLEAMRNTGIENTNISACCRGKVKTAGKFIWKFNY